MSLRKIDIDELMFNPFEKIGKDWMLITSGSTDNFNTMTASWGQLGVLWNKNVLTCYIRPNRYTYEFMEKNDIFTASFLRKDNRQALTFCGSHSGRDVDKVKETALTPVELEGGVTFGEADLVFVCRKLYSYDLQESSFLTDDGIPEQFFGTDPYHRAYIAEIIAVYC